MLPKKILLVDDSSTILMMQRFTLRNGPYSLLTATSGEEAIRKAIAEQPDLILLDVVMPRMSGFEACRRLRANASTRHIPIVMLTSDEPASGETSLPCGCTDFVMKPINASELLVKVRTILGDEDAEEAAQ